MVAQSRRVLVVEDDLNVATALGRIADEAFGRGTNIVFTSTLAGALGWLESSRIEGRFFDLVTLDLGLQDSSGWATFQAMEKAVRAARSRMISITAEPDEDIHDSIEAAGVPIFLKPPRSIRDLIAKMREIVEQPIEAQPTFIETKNALVTAIAGFDAWMKSQRTNSNGSHHAI